MFLSPFCRPLSSFTKKNNHLLSHAALEGETRGTHVDRISIFQWLQRYPLHISPHRKRGAAAGGACTVIGLACEAYSCAVRIGVLISRGRRSTPGGCVCGRAAAGLTASLVIGRERSRAPFALRLRAGSTESEATAFQSCTAASCCPSFSSTCKREGERTD